MVAVIDMKKETRKWGFYWVTEHGCLPTIAYYRQGVWTFSGSNMTSPDRNVTVISAVLAPPEAVS